MTYFGRQEFYEKLLEECRSLIQAEICSLFLVSSQKDLNLRAMIMISEEKRQKLLGFGYRNYKESKGMRCWILQTNKAFNVRSYEPLLPEPKATIGDIGMILFTTKIQKIVFVHFTAYH